MFSHRTDWTASLNKLTVERRKRSDLLDLTETNPTRAGIGYPQDELAEIFARAARAPYDPDPRGLRSAREALAAAIESPLPAARGEGQGEGSFPVTPAPHPNPLPARGERGLDADEFILTASTSEAYSFIFKLLTDPGDEVITATPSYPLLEHLAALELITLRTFPLEFHRRWEMHGTYVKDNTRAIVVVNPNNPTGSFVTPREQDAAAAMGIPVISDEVFLDYPLDATGTTFVRDDVLTFTLGGLSKSAGLPHYKLAWIRVSGPGKREALDALELIADNFLSVATPVQVALPELLRIAPRIRDAIRARTRRNLDILRAASSPHVQVLPVEGGWSVVLRVPRTMTDEELALKILDRGVVVQPGYFFDFATDGYIVLSLLTREDVFAEGVRRVIESI
ncbi:MAG TPA: pyridoxal phosphate-dependent aminotransferase [Thermoanaerobaculia bacterium]|nr:pyridoxal phosphate-dependent aminotransferase [Thermoanaerobaculia bacterium]